MKFILSWVFIFFSLLAGCTNDEEELSVEEAGKEVIRLLQEEEYETIHESWFDTELQESLSVDELSEEWKAKTAEEEFIEIHSLEKESRTDELDIVRATLDYTTIQFEVRLIFNENQRLVGYSLSEGIMHAEMPDSIVEEEIIIGEGTDYELEGLLTLPAEADEKLPAVVLVHGSGPSDRDEAVFAYKPFRDIAWGLAEQGIAVVRYDKRTYTYGREMVQNLGSQLTVYEETVEDAILAGELVKADPRIDENQIFIAGHSLGGMLAPRIEAQGGDYAGLIILAGTPRRIWEVAYDQNLAAIEMMITEEDEQEKQLALAEEEYEKAKHLQNITDQEAREMTVFGMNGYYLKEMDQYDVPTLVQEIEKPLLILQGEDDFQIYFDTDFVLWQELLSDHDQATLISYPGLNHSFIAYEGPHKGTPAEYETPGQVDEKVIQDIGKWIWKQTN